MNKTGNLLDLRLFVGFELSSCLKKEFEKANPHLVHLFTSSDNYLQKASVESKDYLGKYTSFPLTLNDLIDIEKHLTSLLRRLAPSYPFEKSACVLLGLPS
jgi:hypothetical protein